MVGGMIGWLAEVRLLGFCAVYPELVEGCHSCMFGLPDSIRN
jgi:hypothetical protein